MRRLSLLVTLLPCVGFATVKYRLEVDPPAKSVAVSVSTAGGSDTETFRIPAWCPGFYFIQDYQKKISDFKALDAAGNSLSVTQPDVRAWTVKNPSKGPVTISYRVLGDDSGLGFFGVNVRQETTFVNGPAAFMYPEGRKEEPTVLWLKLPDGWKTATGMRIKKDGSLTAKNYDELLDHPLQLGHFVRETFEVMGVPFEAVYVVTSGKVNADSNAEAARLKAISEASMRVFGGAPFEKYVYIHHLAVGGFGGGLEHRASTVMAVSNAPQLHIDDLAAHEFFHTWNVKHIRPKVLGPFDYTQPVRTGNLWFAEGVTDYYAKLIVYRSGLGDEARLAQQLSSEIRSLQSSRTRRQITLEDASRQAWENGGFGVGDLSYYNKGLVAGLILDAAIRGTSKGSKSLDDVMRLLYQRHKLPNPGFDEDSLRIIVNEVAGADLSGIYTQTMRSTQEVPYEVLNRIGLRVLEPGKSYPVLPFRVSNGIVSEAPSGLGLEVGERVIAVRRESQDAARVLVDGQGEQRSLLVPLRFERALSYLLERNPFATVEEQARLTEWLKRP